MGGTTSKLDETNWEEADGKLSSSEHTLDGAPPTRAYGTYFLTKKAMNQREFEVTDSEKNLLFVTRAVPGTIACFDVLSAKSIADEYLLRIYVDVARRYWSVYRFALPAFEGQKPDREMTDKLSLEFSEKPGSPPTPFLYKKALITVSWSRYMAVAALYGAPTVEQLMQRRMTMDADQENSSDGGDDLFEEALQIAERMKDRAPEEDEDPRPATPPVEDKKEADDADQAVAETKDEDNAADSDADGKEPPRNDPPGVSIDSSSQHVHQSHSMPDLASPLGDPDEIPTSMTAASDDGLAAPSSRRNMREWIRQQSSQLLEKSQAYLGSTAQKTYQDPLEGVIQLDYPLLLCQEIYHKLFIGNHQTCIVSKKNVLDLLQQDIEHHVAETHGDLEEEDKNDPLLSAQAEIDRIKASPGRGEEESKDPVGSRPVENYSDTSESNNEEKLETDQPLVGHWEWKNSLRVHKMKMHVAKGSDLCLHVVLAIIVNQVRYERNAIAMTV